MYASNGILLRSYFKPQKLPPILSRKNDALSLWCIRLPRRCFDELTISSQHSTKYPPIKYLPFDIFFSFFLGTCL